MASKEITQWAKLRVLNPVAHFVLKEKWLEVKIFVDSKWQMAWIACQGPGRREIGRLWTRKFGVEKGRWTYRSGMACEDSFITC